MFADLVLLLLTVLVGALMVVVHLLTVRDCWHTEQPRWVRLLAIVPFLAPVIAYRGGYRPSGVIWTLTLGLYIGLRFAG